MGTSISSHSPLCFDSPLQYCMTTKNIKKGCAARILRTIPILSLIVLVIFWIFWLLRKKQIPQKHGFSKAVLCALRENTSGLLFDVEQMDDTIQLLATCTPSWRYQLFNVQAFLQEHNGQEFPEKLFHSPINWNLNWQQFSSMVSASKIAAAECVEAASTDFDSKDPFSFHHVFVKPVKGSPWRGGLAGLR